MTPLVSVITPTFNRPTLLVDRCVPSVEAQTYDSIEHIIVSDGPDEQLVNHFNHFRSWKHWRRFIELGRNTQELEDHWGATPRLVGSYMAHGEYIAYLDDDNEYHPNHVTALVNLLQQTGVDVAFSQQNRVGSGVLGDGRVEFGHIDTSMVLHRAEILWRVANWRPAGYCSDWDLFCRWKDAGVKFAFLPQVTSTYYPRGN